MSSVTLGELSLSLLTEEGLCEDPCLVCLDSVSKAAAFLHDDMHPVHIDCLKGLIVNLKPLEELLCVHCRKPIPEAMVHAESPSEQAKRLAAYRAEANGADDPQDPLDEDRWVLARSHNRREATLPLLQVAPKAAPARTPTRAWSSQVCKAQAASNSSPA